MSLKTTQNSSLITLVPLISVVGPFLIWPIEYLIPFPYIIEELYKLLVVSWIIKSNLKISQMIFLTISFGLLFTFSESIFYFINFIGVSLNPLLLRLLLTGLLHTVTSTIILTFGLINHKLMIPATFITILIHYIYNQLLTL